jgi:hypothetical protein
VQHAARHRWESVQRLSAILHEVHDAEVAASHSIYQLYVYVKYEMFTISTVCMRQVRDVDYTSTVCMRQVQDVEVTPA